MTNIEDLTREAIVARFATVGEQLSFRSMSYWTGRPNEDPVCFCYWQRGGGGLKQAVERDRQQHIAAENAKRLAKIVLLTADELWLRDGVGKPGLTSGGVALPVFVEDRLVGAVAAMDREAGQLPEADRYPLRALCMDIAGLPGLPTGED